VCGYILNVGIDFGDYTCPCAALRQEGSMLEVLPTLFRGD